MTEKTAADYESEATEWAEDQFHDFSIAQLEDWEREIQKAKVTYLAELCVKMRQNQLFLLDIIARHTSLKDLKSKSTKDLYNLYKLI